VNPPRKPDYRVATPSQVVPSRWVNIGSAWDCRTEDGGAYIGVQLDVMPPTGKLTLFPANDPPISRERRRNR
jgi:uncharacterized protein (DUF736 family)